MAKVKIGSKSEIEKRTESCQGAGFTIDTECREKSFFEMGAFTEDVVAFAEVLEAERVELQQCNARSELNKEVRLAEEFVSPPPTGAVIQEEDVAVPQRPERSRCKPKYFEDYVM